MKYDDHDGQIRWITMINMAYIVYHDDNEVKYFEKKYN